jgi:CheY-like chemotaxis protein
MRTHKPRLFLISDDKSALTIATQLAEKGYEVSAVPYSLAEVQKLTRQFLPLVIVLHTPMPLLRVYEDVICLDLMLNTRTQHIPFIFVVRQDEELPKHLYHGRTTDDYVVQPFTMEMIEAAISRVEQYLADRRELEKSLYGHTFDELHDFIPLDERKLEILISSSSVWTWLDFNLENLDYYTKAFLRHQIFVAAQEFMTDDDLVGEHHPDHFALITFALSTDTIIDAISVRIEQLREKHYAFIEQEYGQPRQIPIPLRVKTISNATQVFSSIDEILAEIRDEGP